MKRLNEKQQIMFSAENGCSKALVKKAHRQFYWLFFFFLNPDTRKGEDADIFKEMTHAMK